MHVRFSPEPIKSTYLVNEPHFISCSTDTYLFKYDMLKGLRKGGTFLLNTAHTGAELEAFLPNKVKRQLAEKEAKFYVVDANKVAYEIGLDRRINTIMQSAFFKLNEQLMPFEKANKLMKEAALETYGRRGMEVVELNYKAIDAGGDLLTKVEVKPEWKALKDDAPKKDDNRPAFVKNLADIVNAIEGDSLPVSAFMDYQDAHMEAGSTAYEKRGIANFVPQWKPETCIQCNACVFACPHAVIRSFIVDENEQKDLPECSLTKPAQGRDMQGKLFSIQISTLDCTGCGVCVEVCPTKPNKSLEMVPIGDELAAGKQQQADHFFNNVTYKDLGSDNMKNAMFRQPLFEFSGACAGCGETPYIKAVTQLFGDRMIIANATGCHRFMVDHSQEHHIQQMNRTRSSRRIHYSKIMLNLDLV